MQDDPDTVPSGEAADHEQTHVARVVRDLLESDVVAGLQPHVGHPAISVGQTETGVGDPHHDPAVGGPVAGYPHGRRRRGIA